MCLEMTKHHFATDNFSSSSYGDYRASNNRGPREPPSGSSANRNREEDEIRKAIELSKETYKKDQEIRIKKQSND